MKEEVCTPVWLLFLGGVLPGLCLRTSWTCLWQVNATDTGSASSSRAVWHAIRMQPGTGALRAVCCLSSPPHLGTSEKEG